MNLEISIKVPLGGPEVSIEQRAAAAAPAEEMIPPPPLPESFAPAETADDVAERLGPYWEGVDGAEESGNGGRRGAIRADGAREVSPPSPEELGIETGVAAEAAPPPDPRVLEASAPMSGVPPGLEEMDLEGLADVAVEALPPPPEELESMAAEPAVKRPSAKSRKRSPKAGTKSGKTPRKSYTKATSGEADEA